MTSVTLIEKMGSDLSIVRAARLTSNKNDQQSQSKEDSASIASLIRYLIRHRHTSPFEFGKLHFEIECPIFVARQILRHRTANVNEFSQRYSDLPEEFDCYRPGSEKYPWRGQSKNNRQASSGIVNYKPGEYSTNELDGLSAEAICGIEYFKRRTAGVSREQARSCLPLGTFTRMRFCMDLHNLFNFIRLRSNSDAQQETAEVARLMLAIAREHFPISVAAFCDYMLNSITLSALDIKMIVVYPINANHLDSGMLSRFATSIGMSSGEYQEHMRKRAVLSGELTTGSTR